ncbi:hypothetical protein [Nonomuraea sp. bgisy101]|uniref:hypothetical protein n=1 Tax=Nonomuraea sp. bgisy101 TaxID=3413784 RepID=UPI003D72F19E
MRAGRGGWRVRAVAFALVLAGGCSSAELPQTGPQAGAQGDGPGQVVETTASGSGSGSGPGSGDDDVVTPESGGRRYTLNSGPTLDSDFSAPHGQNDDGALCLSVSGGGQGEVKVTRVSFQPAASGVFDFVEWDCATAPAAFPCEGSVLAGGKACAFRISGQGGVMVRARVVLHLEQRCTGRDSPACSRLPGSVTPSADRPVTVAWPSTFGVRYCPPTFGPGHVTEKECEGPPRIGNPDESPTAQPPTDEATPSPTAEPTVEPTAEPTADPTVEE